MFLHGESELEAFNSQKLFAPFLWGKALCPDDHPAFFAAVVDALCGAGYQSGECSLVVKVGSYMNGGLARPDGSTTLTTYARGKRPALGGSYDA